MAAISSTGQLYSWAPRPRPFRLPPTRFALPQLISMNIHYSMIFLSWPCTYNPPVAVPRLFPSLLHPPARAIQRSLPALSAPPGRRRSLIYNYDRQPRGDLYCSTPLRSAVKIACARNIRILESLSALLSPLGP